MIRFRAITTKERDVVVRSRLRRCRSTTPRMNGRRRGASSTSVARGKDNEVERSTPTVVLSPPPPTITTAAATTPNDDNDDNNINNDDTLALYKRMLALARPEHPLLAGAALTLGASSSVTLLLPYCSGVVVDAAVEAHAHGTPMPYSPYATALGLFGLNAVAGAGVYARSLLLTIAGNRVVERLRGRLFAALLERDVAFFDGRAKQENDSADAVTTTTTSTGDLLSRLTTDARLTQEAVTSLTVDALRASVIVVGSTWSLVSTSPELALVSLSSLPPVFLASRVGGQRLRERQETVQKLFADATAVAEESLGPRGVRTVKYFAAEDRERGRHRKALRKAHAADVSAGRGRAALAGGVHLAANAAVWGVLGYGGTMVLDGRLSGGDLTSFLMYSLLAAGSIAGLSGTYASLSTAMAGARRVYELLDEEESVDERTDDDSLPPALLADAPVSIELRDVRFSYPAAPTVPVLDGVTFSVAPGESVAIVGRSGGGKSTLAALLTKLYDVDDGSVSINGVDLRSVSGRALRRRVVGVVPQDPHLFDGTVAENVRYGRPEADDAAVARAVREADAPDPDAEVGPQGTRLSGGQRQRVAVARAIVKRAPLMILDEATSALDAESERRVRERALNGPRRADGATVVSISHRLETVRAADRVLVLDKGRVAEEGTFDELQAREGGPFRQLMGTQIK